MDNDSEPPKVVFIALGFAAVVAALVVFVAWASPARSAETPKLTILDCQTIFSGLTALDGHNEITKDQTSVVVAYQFASAKLRMAIQSNLAALAAVQDTFTKTQQGIFREIAGGGSKIEPGKPEFDRYNKQITELQQQPCDVTLTRINAADLKLDKNEIPGSVLGALDKILEK